MRALGLSSVTTGHSRLDAQHLEPAASLHFYLTQNVRLDDSTERFRTALNHHDLGYMVIHSEEGLFNILGVEFVPFCARLFFPTLTGEVAHFSPTSSGDQAFIELSTKIHASQDTTEQVALLDDFFCQRFIIFVIPYII